MSARGGARGGGRRGGNNNNNNNIPGSSRGGSGRGRAGASATRGGGAGRGSGPPGSSSGSGRGGGRGGSSGGRGVQPQPPPPPAAAVFPPMPPAAPASATASRPPASSYQAIESLSDDLEEKASVTPPASAPRTSSLSQSQQLVAPAVRMHFPSRLGFGRVGTPVKIFANHYPVTFAPQSDVFHYDVAFSENGRSFGNDGPPKALATKIMAALLGQFKRDFPTLEVVGDNRKNLYTPRQLPFTEQTFAGLTLADDDRTPPKTFAATVKAADPVAIRLSQLDELFAGRLNYTPYDALQALDIAMRHTATTRFTAVGRNLFSPVGKKPIGEGADLWFGYFQSLRATQSKLVVNLDLAATAFVQAMSVVDFCCATLGMHSLPATMNRSQAAAVSKALAGVKVQITHRPGVKRQYRVNRLSRDSAEQTFFDNDDGTRQSVAAYFRSAYNVHLRYPKLPCVHVGALKGTNYMPLEVCTIVAGQKSQRKATDSQVANMIRFTCTPPQERKRAIDAKFREAGFATDPVLQAFGLNVSPNMAQVPARLLPVPSLAYKQGTIKPDTGMWNMRGKAFFQPAKLNSWAVISCCDPRRNPQADLDKFFRAVIAQMGQLGMNPPKQLPPILVKPRHQPIRNAFDDAMQAAQAAFKTKPQVIWMVNPVADANAYGDLKRASDTEVGIVSQCMLAKHIQKCNPQYIANILMKVNVKLGGKNTVIAENLPKFGKGTIVFGADVTHPSPFDRTRPSVAAVVASIDNNFVKHAASIRAQGHRVEQIEYLRDMVVDLMKRYYRELRSKPERIVFYRDGVSEGQFHMVLNYEITAIREACAMLEPSYAPPITFIVVQKRHNTRFFPIDARGGDRSGNVKAGTVVDSVVCHPVEHDFYLMSHAGLQGTSRPTHYHVLLDETGYSADEIQSITYKLCYTFARCTRSVSLVPAAYYSHLLAFRARFFQLDGSETASMSSASSQSTVDVDTRMLEIHNNLKQVMFYV